MHNQRLISMTYWYPIISSLARRLADQPRTRVVMEGKNLKEIPAQQNPLRINFPDTVFVHYPYGREIWRVLDGEKPKGFDEFKAAIDAAASQFGYPVFLRTEQSSDKHSWKDTCFLLSKDKIGWNVGALVEHSAMADLPCDFFAVRRLIETEPVCTAFNGEMPIAKERRLFAKDGKVLCNHPYWPNEAFENEDIPAEKIKVLQQTDNADLQETNLMAEHVTKYIPNAWSIDFLRGKDGKWWLIDMALAESSYHWPQCENRGLEVDVDLITGARTVKVPETAPANQSQEEN